MYTGNRGCLCCLAGQRSDWPHLLFIEWCFALPPLVLADQPVLKSNVVSFALTSGHCLAFQLCRKEASGKEVTEEAARPEQYVCCSSMLSGRLAYLKGFAW